MIAISAVIAGAMACVGFNDQGVSFLFGVWTIDTTDYAQGNELGRAIIGSILVKWIGVDKLGPTGAQASNPAGPQPGQPNEAGPAARRRSRRPVHRTV